MGFFLSFWLGHYQVWVPCMYFQALFFLLILTDGSTTCSFCGCFCSVATAASCCCCISMCVWLFGSYCSLVGILGVSSSHQRIFPFLLDILVPWITTGDAKPGCLWPQILRVHSPHPFPLILCFLQHLKHLLCSVLGQSYLSL